jgi:hypothetical protein
MNSSNRIYPYILYLHTLPIVSGIELSMFSAWQRAPRDPVYLACTSPKVKNRKQTLIISRLTGIKTVSIFTGFLGPSPTQGANSSH